MRPVSGIVRRGVMAMAMAPLLLGAAPRPLAGDLPRSAIAVYHEGRWHEWWHSARAPSRWTARHTPLGDAMPWRTLAPGVEAGELRLAGSGEAWRVRLIVARVDPAAVRFALATSSPGERADWTIDRAPDDALVALNAGQFTPGGPWGWIVQDGREVAQPGTGPLAPALAIDRDGRVRFIEPAQIAEARRAPLPALAVQSYPALLLGDGAVPRALMAEGRGVNVRHRDARLAIGETRDGRLLIALTRFEGLGGALSVLPFGFTTPEMAAIMGALGARRAMLLDGGISGQLLLRDAGGETQRWPALRKVPVGLVVSPR